jgi:transposase
MSKRAAKRPLEMIDPHAAGIDLGSTSHFVSVNPGNCEEPIREYGCFTADLHQMGKWLLQNGATSVAMEATGVYWVPVYEILSSMGLKVLLVDARKAHGLPGRKSDVQDCQWLRELQTYGLLSSCFVPDSEVLGLRSYHRQRESLVGMRATQIQMMQKALEQMNLQLHKVLDDITGVTGMEIIRAILSGERDPRVLAAKRRPGVKRSEEDVIKALEANYAEHHMFSLRQAVELYDYFGAMIKDVDDAIERELKGWCKAHGRTPVQTKRRHTPRKNQAHFDLAGYLEGLAGIDLTQIDGLDSLSVLAIFSECGMDYSRWKSHKHFTSWLRLAPCNRISGGKRLRRGPHLPSSGKAATIFRVAAQSLHRSKSALGHHLRSIAARRTMPVAIKAIARKIAIAFYNAMTKGQEYLDIGAAAYAEQLERQRLRRMHNLARRMGYELVPILPQAELATATVP